MNNKELTKLLYKLLEIVIVDGAGNTIRPSEEIDRSNVVQAIESVSGEAPSLQTYLNECYPSEESLDEVLRGYFEGCGGSLGKKEIKNYLKNEQNFPVEILKDAGILWMIEKFKKFKNEPKSAETMKPVTKKLEPVSKTEKTQELIKCLYKFIQNQKCGNAVDAEHFFSNELIKESVNEIFGKQLDLFDIYSEKEITEDLLWDYEGGADADSIKDFLEDEKEVSEELLTKSVIEKLVEMV